MMISFSRQRSKLIVLAFCYLLLSVLAACSIPVLTSTPTPTVTVRPTAKATSLPTMTPTPQNKLVYTPAQQLLAKYVLIGPVYVTGDKSVSDAALKAAGEYLAAMLKHRPDVVIVLRQFGTFTAVSSSTERICDLPYFSHYDSALCQAYGDGGAGGILGSPITACGEKNLLQEPGDDYLRGVASTGQNICVHELAHTIMDVGLSSDDRYQIYQRYLAAKAEGLWTGDYAMTNELEFWAVMSQFYFWAGPNSTYSPAFNHVANGPDALKKYDPATYALLDSIYQGSTNLQ